MAPSTSWAAGWANRAGGDRGRRHLLPRLGETPLYDSQQLLDAEGLGDDVGGAEVGALPQIARIEMGAARRAGMAAGHGDDRRVGGERANGADGRGAVHLRHRRVAEHEVDAILLEPANAFLAASCRNSLVAARSQHRLDSGTNEIVVFDDQDSGHGGFPFQAPARPIPDTVL
jgi:hypothetical protein